MLDFFAQTDTSGANGVIQEMNNQLPDYVAGYNYGVAFYNFVIIAVFLGVITLIRFIPSRRRAGGSFSVAAKASFVVADKPIAAERTDIVKPASAVAMPSAAAGQGSMHHADATHSGMGRSIMLGMLAGIVSYALGWVISLLASLYWFPFLIEQRGYATSVAAFWLSVIGAVEFFVAWFLIVLAWASFKHRSP